MATNEEALSTIDHEVAPAEAWDAIAAGYDEFVAPGEASLANEGLRLAGLKPGERFLDVAAGPGGLSLPAARLGAKVLATDWSAAMIARFEARVHEEGLAEAEGRVMDAHALELDDDSFDLTGSQFGVMLVPDQPLALREMVRVTKPGGRVLLIAYGPPAEFETLQFFIAALQAVVPDFEGLPDDPPPLEFQVADSEVLRQRLTDAGLHNVTVDTTHEERVEFRSGEQIWNWVLGSNPIARTIVGDLPEDQQATVRQVLDGMLRERSGGNGPAVLTAPLNIGVGTKYSGRDAMSIIEDPPLDAEKLEQFVFRAVDEVGATLNAALVVMGDRLGLYRALAGAGALTSGELAARTGAGERYLREWLNAQAAGGFVEYHPTEGRYSLAPEQAVALTDEDSPAYLPGFFQIALGSVLDSPRITEAMRSGAGVGWHEHNHDVHDGCERFFRPGYNANLLACWLPALTGVVDRLQRGARVADVGCGHGASTILMAGAFPNSTFIGSDYHAGSIETARRRAREAGVEDRVRFEATPAAAYSGEGYDLVTTFDCLHDMGDPVGAARHVLSTLAPDGTWMIVEPAAGDRVEDNLNPVGRAYYGFSTLLCTPASLSQDVGLALGAQAGPARIADVVAEAGFSRFRRAAQTPFNLVFEVRP